jgi:hypothetical protein
VGYRVKSAEPTPWRVDQASRTFLATATPMAMRMRRTMIFFIGTPAIDGAEPVPARPES